MVVLILMCPSYYPLSIIVMEVNGLLKANEARLYGLITNMIVNVN